MSACVEPCLIRHELSQALLCGGYINMETRLLEACCSRAKRTEPSEIQSVKDPINPACTGSAQAVRILPQRHEGRGKPSRLKLASRRAQKFPRSYELCSLYGVPASPPVCRFSLGTAAGAGLAVRRPDSDRSADSVDACSLWGARPCLSTPRTSTARRRPPFYIPTTAGGSSISITFLCSVQLLTDTCAVPPQLQLRAGHIRVRTTV